MSLPRLKTKIADNPGDIPNETPHGPEWAICFGKLAHMIGKSKDEVVKAAGVPNELNKAE